MKRNYYLYRHNEYNDFSVRLLIICILYLTATRHIFPLHSVSNLKMRMLFPINRCEGRIGFA